MLDEAAIAALAERYGPMVLRRCRRLLVDEEDARDACQDVFVRVVTGRRRIDARALSSLLYRIATNICLNRLRDGRRGPERAEQGVLDRIASAEEPSAMSDARLVLERLFARHPASSRTIAVLHYVDGLTLEETAAVAGLSVSGVRRRLRLLRHVLRELQS
ncbi:MAG: RNA polymerase sigma factor [Vicinamibacterales bacterium]